MLREVGKAGASGGSAANSMDQLEFKDDYQSSSHASPVAVVLLHDDYSPPLGYYYFRQTAFSQFNGVRLVASTRDDVDRLVPSVDRLHEILAAEIDRAGKISQGVPGHVERRSRDVDAHVAPDHGATQRVLITAHSVFSGKSLANGGWERSEHARGRARHPA